MLMLTGSRPTGESYASSAAECRLLSAVSTSAGASVRDAARSHIFLDFRAFFAGLEV